MTTTTPAGFPTIGARIHTLNRPNMVSVGVIVWLASELMFFAGLFGIYFTARAVNVGPWPPKTVHLDIYYDLVFTIILILSSFTCQFGVWAAERGDVFALRRWYIVSFLMGLTFIVGQSIEFAKMVHDGTTIATNAYGTVFYLTTGFHGLHVIGGLIAFIFLIARTKLAKFTPAQATSAIVVSYYWHFVDIVWIALFTTIFIIR